MKILIGTLVAWYESALVPLYLESIYQALDYLSNLDIHTEIEIHLDFYVTSPWNGLEKEIEGYNGRQKCIDSIREFEDSPIPCVMKFGGSYVHINIRYDSDDRKATYETENIAYYRRELINKGRTEDYDAVVWGETDSLVPHTFFANIYSVTLGAITRNSPVISSFGGCKLWDPTWKITEHVAFTDRPFIENDTENWWSLKYTMNLEEMNAINSKHNCLNPDVYLATKDNIKFNGCGLIITKPMLQTGVNISDNVFFIIEDTSFMMNIKNIVPNAEQIIFPAILLVHNRKSPLKRTGIIGEEEIKAGDVGAKRKTQNWYPVAQRMCEANVYAGMNYSWQDVWNEVNKTK